MTTTRYHRRPNRRAVNAEDESYEQIFLTWLKQQGYEVFHEWEPHAFDIPPRSGHKEFQHPTPDIWVLGLPTGERVDDGGPILLYLELCGADRFIAHEQLTRRTRRRNRCEGQSGKPCLPSADYLRLKRQRMRQIELCHPGVIVEVLDYAAQLACIADPTVLTNIIERRLVALSSPARAA